MKITDLLLEKAPLEVSKLAHIVFAFLADNLQIRDGAKRGAGFDDTGMYQIRIMPIDPKNPGNLLDDTFKLMKSAKKLQAKNVQINKSSPHSSKFSSVQFSIGSATFDVVCAAGANKGEKFEDDLFLAMNNYAAGIEDNPIAKQAFAALVKVNGTIKPEKVDSVVKRTGSTKRSQSKSPQETGKIIADIIIKMKGGKEHYISVKDSNGDTVANFGISEAFDDNLNVNVKTDTWKKWLAPFGLDANKVSKGLQAYVSGQPVDWPEVETPNKPIGKTIDSVLRNLWGLDYIYLRKTASGFEAKNIDTAYLDSILNKMKVTKIVYPSPARKQITITCESAETKLMIEIRNPSGQVRPKDLKMKIVGRKSK